MRVFVNLKQIGKRRAAVAAEPYEVEFFDTVGGLIDAFVRSEVARFNARAEGHSALDYLTADKISDQSTAGKIAFGRDPNGNLQDLAAAVENARLSFIDGIYRIFLNDEEVVGELDAKVDVKDGDTLTFVRLTMLAGRQW